MVFPQTLEDICPMSEKSTLECKHCHQPITDMHWDDTQTHAYCCYGCKVVDELLSSNRQFFNANTLKIQPYLYLDEPKIQAGLLDFQEGNFARLTMHLPAIHCSSCIYLLESLTEVQEGIHEVQVSFAKKEAHISFNKEILKLSKLAALLQYIGYPPDFQTKAQSKNNNTLLIQLGVAGFFFGNTMLLALPEYLDTSLGEDQQLQQFFRYLMLGFSLPVLLYSAKDYFISAYKALHAGILGIDLPIALGIATLFLRSVYEVLQGTGAGYFDSLCGLVFFLLLGKWYQQKTYQNFTFDRDFNSFIPLAANVLLKNGKEKAIPVGDLQKGDIILVRNGEVLPADAEVQGTLAILDYSYITGESLPIEKQKGQYAFAGARIKGNAVEMLVQQSVSHSYLSSLWNKNEAKHNTRNAQQTLTNKIARYFTPAILGIALIAALIWSTVSVEKAVTVFTAVLIVACPCALALAEPFAAGSMMRWFGQHGLYLKNSGVLNKLHEVNQLVFDKTGTLTEQNSMEARWHGTPLTRQQQKALYTLTLNSGHPLSKAIAQYFNAYEVKDAVVKAFQEVEGSGIYGDVNEVTYTLGNAAFVGLSNTLDESRVYAKKGNEVLGYFTVAQRKRDQLKPLLHQLKQRYTLALLSGDNASEKQQFSALLGEEAELHFNQAPHEKLQYIKQLQHNNKRVLMLGDGLNDAGALQQSDVGISLCEKNVNFFPASDALLLARSFDKLAVFLKLSHINKLIVHRAFALSLVYNLGGLSFALAGILSPLVCAILMPLSSISVVIYTTLASRHSAQKALN